MELDKPKVNGAWQVTESLVLGLYDRAPTCSYVGEYHTPEITVIPVSGGSVLRQSTFSPVSYVRGTDMSMAWESAFIHVIVSLLGRQLLFGEMNWL